MRKLITAAVVLILVLVLAPNASSQQQATPAASAAKSDTAAPAVSKFKPGVKVFVEAMPDGFDQFLKDAMKAKKVPATIVATKEEAEFTIRGTSETQKASTAKKVIMWNWHSNEQASIQVVNNSAGEVVFAYTANKQSSAHGKRSTAEACAKHIKEELEKSK